MDDSNSMSLLHSDGGNEDVLHFQEDLVYSNPLGLEDSSRSSSPKIKLDDLTSPPSSIDPSCSSLDIEADSVMMFGTDLSSSDMKSETEFSLDDSNLLKDSMVEEIHVEESTTPPVSEVPSQVLPDLQSKDLQLQFLSFPNGVVLLDTSILDDKEKIRLGIIEDTSGSDLAQTESLTLDSSLESLASTSQTEAVTITTLQTQDAVIGHIVKTDSGRQSCVLLV
jgi:hypothetical protein